jgi:N-acyl-D-aspartate/D-glutamate deacylase
MRLRFWLTLMAVSVLSACSSGVGVSGPIVPAPANDAEERTPMPTFDVIIENGRIVDGTGNAWFYGDVAIKGDRIARITPRGVLRSETATRRLDATGQVVSPGFIDIQSQSDFALLAGDGRIVSKVSQGITTEIMGEGNTAAPVSPASVPAPQADESEGVRRRRSYSVEGGFGRWLGDMESHGASANLGAFVGASTIRRYARGAQMGPSDTAQLDTMKAAVRRAMEDGAFGVASALIYPPGNFASTLELGEIAAAMAPYGGLYITHMRSEADKFLEAIDEAIHIGQRGGVAVEIFHLKAAGRRNWDKASQAIAKIDSARAAGVDVQANMYPYTAGGTGLTACFPPWASADGKLFDNLADAEMRTRMYAEITSQTEDWENLCTLATPEGVLLLGLNQAENQKYVGRYLSDVARELGQDWIETAFDLVLSERQRVGTIYFLMSEDNVRLQLQSEWIKFGTDAGGVDPEKTTAMVHPRAYGTYPRILGRYVREAGVLSLEDAVRKMTSAVATRLSIADRGLLREGFFADIVVFDPATVIDRATYEDPHQLSEGILQVFVNGVRVVEDGEHTGKKPGRALRGPGYRLSNGAGGSG